MSFYFIADLMTIKSDEPITSKKTKCLRACIMGKIGIIDSKGKLDKKGCLRVAKDILGNSVEILISVGKIVDICSQIKISSDK